MDGIFLSGIFSADVIIKSKKTGSNWQPRQDAITRCLASFHWCRAKTFSAVVIFAFAI